MSARPVARRWSAFADSMTIIQCDVVKKRCTVSSGWMLWFARLKIEGALESREEYGGIVLCG